jgi:Domain of unknown function (DUF1905)/Bacteriocin-protection, YdeI or OmpD-Associated
MMTESMAKSGTKGKSRESKPGTARALGDSTTASKIRFNATLFRPVTTAKAAAWTFLTLPKEASAKLPSRGMTSVEGTFNGLAFRATLEPDGKGGHWLKVDRKLREEAGAEAGEVVSVEIATLAKEPEPKVPADLRRALAAAHQKARAVWSDITPVARRDWIQWIESAKREKTRLKRIESACDMLANGKRRPCCFDRSGIYAKNLSCPIADDRSRDTRP